MIRQPVNSGRPFGSAPWLGVSTKRLNEQGKRKRPRFPDDLMFQLTAAEAEALRSQYATLKPGRGQHRTYLPHAFTATGEETPHRLWPRLRHPTVAYATIGRGTAKHAAQQLSDRRWTGKLPLQRTLTALFDNAPQAPAPGVQGEIVYTPLIFG